MTNSPGAEIVVSSGLPRARVSPPPPVQQTPNIEEPMPDAAESHHKNEQPRQDEASKRSFKRKYRKLLNKYLTIRANNQTLHQTYDLALSTASQLSNQNAYILDSILALNPATFPLSPPGEEDADPPTPSAFNRDAHFGYTPSPSPPPEAATQLTQEQIDMGMFKAYSPSTVDMMRPPQSIQYQDDGPDTFKSRSTTGGGLNASTRRGGSRGAVLMVPSTARRKRKDRENEVDESAVTAVQKKSRR